MDLLSRLLAWIIVIVILCVCSPLILVLLAFAVLAACYELTPWRRRQVLDFEMCILSVLRNEGEVKASELWRKANSATGSSFHRPTFYWVMNQLDEEGFVERRKIDETIEVEDETFVVSGLWYQLTRRGKKVSLLQRSMRRTLSALPKRTSRPPS